MLHTYCPGENNWTCTCFTIRKTLIIPMVCSLLLIITLWLCSSVYRVITNYHIVYDIVRKDSRFCSTYSVQNPDLMDRTNVLLQLPFLLYAREGVNRMVHKKLQKKFTSITSCHLWYYIVFNSFNEQIYRFSLVAWSHAFVKLWDNFEIIIVQSTEERKSFLRTRWKMQQ